jgi:Tol biopolymer transport system component
MLAGQPPFTGPTVESVVHQHLTAEPPSVTAIRPSVPGWVAAALERSLAKTPADRFNPVALFGEAISPRTSVTAADAQPLAAASSRRRWLVPGVVAAALVVAVGVMLVRMMAPGPISITTSNISRVTTDPGLEFQPAISPNGTEVAYVSGFLEAPRLVVRSTIDIGSSGGTRVGKEVGGGHWLPAWTPDGASLRFLACTRGFGSGCDWKEVGTRGGSARTISVPHPSTRHAWSRDGTRTAFVIRDSIFATSVDSAEPELLSVQVARPRRGAIHSLTWSPDGQRIAYVLGNSLWRTTANVLNASLWVLDASGGDPLQVTDHTTMNVSPQWLPDGRHLLFVSDRDGPRGIYVVEVGPDGPRGPPQSVLSSSDAHSISVSADGKRLAYADFTVKQNIWSIPIPRSGSVSIRDAVPVTTGSQVIEQPALSPDGEWIVFESDRGGEFDIYKMPLAGGDPQLVADIAGIEFAPDLSPDGTEIAYYSPEGVFVSADGGTPEQLADFDGAWPDWSPEGLAIAFQSQGPQDVGAENIWIASRDSISMPWSDPVPLTDFRCVFPDWAPDGASLICDAGAEFARVSRGGGVLSRLATTPAVEGYAPLFSHDGSRIYFFGTHQDGSLGMWWIPATGGVATKVVAFDDPSLSVFGGAVGPENLYFTISEYESDIWVMDLEW